MTEYQGVTHGGGAAAHNSLSISELQCQAFFLLFFGDLGVCLKGFGAGGKAEH